MQRWSDARAPLEELLALLRDREGGQRAFASQAAADLERVYAKLGDEAALEALRRSRAGLGSEARAPRRAPAAIASDALFHEPNALDVDGVAAFVHWTPEDGALSVALPLPDQAADRATLEETRDAALAGFRAWERAIQRVLPDFRLELVDGSGDADIAVRWEKRPRGYLPAQGALEHRVENGRLRLHGSVTLSTQPVPNPKYKVSLGELRAHAAHAFGYALGLPDCGRCDSLMSLGWLRSRTHEPTDLDVRTFEALLALRNGERVDGQLLSGLPGGALVDVALAAGRRRDGVRADLPFLNIGREGPVVIDLGKPDGASIVVELDTGATGTVLTTDYARALGVAVRQAKTTEYRRETVTGHPLDFWVTGQAGGEGPPVFDFALLGGDYLREFVVDIDYPRRRVRFLEPRATAIGDLPGELVVPLRVAELSPYARLELGSGFVWALIDTGAESPIAMTEERARKLGVEVDLSSARTGHMNVLGTEVSTVQKLPRALLGPVELRDVELQIAIGEESSVRIARFLQDETLIGSDVLRDFRVRFDYRRQKLGLTPPSPRGPGAARSAAPPDSRDSR